VKLPSVLLPCLWLSRDTPRGGSHRVFRVSRKGWCSHHSISQNFASLFSDRPLLLASAAFSVAHLGAPSMMLSLSQKMPSAALQRQALCSLSTLATSGLLPGSSASHVRVRSHGRSFRKNTIAPVPLLTGLHQPLYTTTIHRYVPVTTSLRTFSSNAGPPSGGGNQQLPPWMHPESNKPGHYLEQYCQDLTALAESDKLDPVIGRHEEIRRCLQILARRTKCNPVRKY